MLRVENNRRRDYSEFDNADTEVLQAFLEADFNAPEDERADVETVIYINKLLCEREDAETDVAAAKEVFRKKYYPIDDDKFLFDFGEDNAAFENKAAAKKKVAMQDIRSSFMRYVAGVAVIFVIVLFGGAVSATAFGYNPWSAIAEWTDEVFWFESAETDAVKNLQQAAIDLYGGIDVVPQWLPEGYQEAELSVVSDDLGENVFAVYNRNSANAAEEVYISISCNTSGTAHSVYEKDAEAVDVYTVDGIEHYIMTNLSENKIVWQNDKVTCSIGGTFNTDEAKKMIDSIY